MQLLISGEGCLSTPNMETGRLILGLTALRMTRTIVPSEQKAQEIAQWLDGQSDVQSGEALLSALIRLSTERVL